MISWPVPTAHCKCEFTQRNITFNEVLSTICIKWQRMVAAGMIMCFLNYERGEKIGLCLRNFEEHKECHASSDAGQMRGNSAEGSGAVTKQDERDCSYSYSYFGSIANPMEPSPPSEPNSSSDTTNLPAFYAVRKFITVFTTASYVTLSRFNP